MKNAFSELLAPLPPKHRTLILSLLKDISRDSWYSAKHLIVCSNPLLTLEMAVNRVSIRERNDFPSCNDIHQALSYADQKRSDTGEVQSEITEFSNNNAA